jgi:hypothetical protein
MENASVALQRLKRGPRPGLLSEPLNLALELVPLPTKAFEFRLALAALLGNLLEFGGEILADRSEFRPLLLVETRPVAGVVGPLASELDAPEPAVPMGLEPSLAVPEVADDAGGLLGHDPADDVGVVIPGEAMPDAPVALGDEVLLDVRRPLGSADDPQPALPAPLGDPDEHLPRVVEGGALG